MHSKIVYACCLALAAGLIVGGCGVAANNMSQTNNSNNSWDNIKQAVAVVHATKGHNVHGTVRFSETADGKVKVVADLEGLTPNQKHGIHVHEFGDCTAADATSAGGHYNPAGTAHALPPTKPRHAGDLGNLQADANGKAHFEMTADTISIAGGQHPIIGRGLIVHEKADTGAQPSGDAGSRFGCGVIGIANSTP